MLAKSVIALLSVAASVSAQFPTNAPACVTSCFTIKISEAGSLAPGVNPQNIAGLCAVPTFIQAYINCLNDNCPGQNATQGILLGQQVCASLGVALPTSGLTGQASSQVGALTPIPISTTSGAAAGATGGAGAANATTTVAGGAAGGASSSGAAAGSMTASGASMTASAASMTASSAASGAGASASSVGSQVGSGAGAVGASATSAVGVATSAVGGALGSATSAVKSGANTVVATSFLSFLGGLVALLA